MKQQEVSLDMSVDKYKKMGYTVLLGVFCFYISFFVLEWFFALIEEIVLSTDVDSPNSASSWHIFQALFVTVYGLVGVLFFFIALPVGYKMYLFGLGSSEHYIKFNEEEFKYKTPLCFSETSFLLKDIRVLRVSENKDSYRVDFKINTSDLKQLLKGKKAKYSTIYLSNIGYMLFKEKLPFIQGVSNCRVEGVGDFENYQSST